MLGCNINMTYYLYVCTLYIQHLYFWMEYEAVSS
jgi:hypothetical protein